jgi:hypothetical protein
MAILDLRDDWADLLKRRSALFNSLVPYHAIVDAWAQWEPSAEAPGWDARECEARWKRGVPLLAETAIEIDAADVEDLFAVGMEAVTATRPQEAAGMRTLADEWDAGRIGPRAFLPAPAGIAHEAARQLGLRADVVAFVACAGLRPMLEWALRGARSAEVDGAWSLGSCPYCGAPPAFGDIVEDGRLQLSCHVCGGTWIFSRVRCPLCGADGPRDLARLEPSGADEAYFIAACTRCRGYVKQIDRRQRWNARTPVVEDWGSPHLDLAARQAGYRRAIPTLLDVADPA